MQEFQELSWVEKINTEPTLAEIEKKIVHQDMLSNQPEDQQLGPWWNCRWGGSSFVMLGRCTRTFDNYGDDDGGD